MANPGNYAKTYRQTAIMTASREQILLMLYEAAIQNVKKASVCIDRKDIPGKGAAIGKAHDIVNELVASLNFEVGGQVAIELDRLYSFIIERLVKANLESSKEHLGVVQKILETLLDGWREAVKQLNQGKGVPNRS